MHSFIINDATVLPIFSSRQVEKRLRFLYIKLQKQIFCRNAINYLVIFFLLFFISCKDNKEDEVVVIDKLIETEKFELAHTKIKNKLSTKRSEDEILSLKSTKDSHILELSNDRNRIVYTENKTVIFRDLANPLVKLKSFSLLPVNISISSDAEHALISLALSNGAGCKIIAVSLLEAREDYSSNSLIPCNHHGGITTDGNIFYYFVDDSLYMETLSEIRQSKLIRDKKNFPSPITNIKNKYYIYPIGKTFLIFAGNAGIYHLYWFDPKKNEEEKIAENIATPKLYYGNGKNAYIITGMVGELNIQELKLSAYGKPTLAGIISINHEKTNPWPTSLQTEFISSFDGEVFRWNLEGKVKYFPLFAEKFWIAARDQIIYEDINKELVIGSLEFTETEQRLLELYRQTKKQKTD